MITAAFSLVSTEHILILKLMKHLPTFFLARQTQQLINLRSLPPLLMKYTSETVQGQVYVPAVNWAGRLQAYPR